MPESTEALIQQALAGQPLPLVALCQKIAGELQAIARAVYRQRGGSPDGVCHESDLAQSVALRIVQNPQHELSAIATTDELRGRLYQLLYERWIERRRAALAQKRGGGLVRVASQIGLDDESQLLANEPAPEGAELNTDLLDLLSVFPVGSERGRILAWLLEGRTHEEIAGELGLSRDAVGRRVRDSLIPELKSRLASEM